MSVAIDLSGKSALVTGASQGIGAAVASLLHRAGASVVLNHPDTPDGRSRHDAETLCAELNKVREGSATVVAADVSDPAAVVAMMKAVQEGQGLDILVNNAGVIRDRTLAKMSVAEWDAVIGVNLSGVFHCCKFGLEVMRDGGCVVNMGSLSAEAGFYGQSNYAAAKAGVQAMTRVLSRECAKRGVRVNAVAPGLVDTPMVASMPDEARERLKVGIPWGRPARPEEVAAAVLFLCSPLASYVTGETLGVNGGWRG